MDFPFNVLITSISKKIPLIKSVRTALRALHLKGKIIGADVNPSCIGRYFVDEFWEAPKQETLKIKELLAFCLQHQVKAIIPTRDGELTFYAKHKKALQEQGIACLISPLNAIKLCTDKLKFSQYLLDNHFPGIVTSDNLKEISAPHYVVKERHGSGSRTIGLNLSLKEAKKHASLSEKPIFQPFIAGEEYSIDLYIDHKQKIKGVIARKRDLVVGGESQITTTVKHPQLENLCSRLAEQLGLYGHAVFQVICDENELMHIVECNPRFGGASTLSVAMGLKSFEWFFLEVLGQRLPTFTRASQEMRQVRHAEDKLVELQDLA